jgi:hypothetical protein
VPKPSRDAYDLPRLQWSAFGAIPDQRSAELELLALEAQLLAQFPVPVFQLRGFLLQVAELVEHFIQLLFKLSILSGLGQLVQFFNPSGCRV